ncbi:MAG: DUF4157 domain-containing protein [Moorea sp. SIO4A3]|nr:DUF4157 domain-containing protein [Moorena sp. SIO4A3]
MTRQYARKSNKSPQKDADNWILQRSAVRELPAKTVTLQTESQPCNRSGIQLDLMEIPVSNHTAMPVQAKLKIGPAGDKYEQEADRVAKQVVQQLHGSQSGKLQPRQTLQRQGNREVDEELQRKPRLQLKGDREGMTTTPELESSITRSRGSGQPLSEGIREPMEKAFGGVDFSGVKVHTDGHSDRLNQSMQAKAFTTGQDVFFRQGAYDPGSQGGQELLAHELTHVVQQNAGVVQGVLQYRAETKSSLQQGKQSIIQTKGKGKQKSSTRKGKVGQQEKEMARQITANIKEGRGGTVFQNNENLLPKTKKNQEYYEQQPPAPPAPNGAADRGERRVVVLADTRTRQVLKRYATYTHYGTGQSSKKGKADFIEF